MSSGKIPVLTPPEMPPQVTMKHPTFDDLTSAEKLNDREYRRKIYQKFSNEPTCKCPKKFHPANSNGNISLCPAGCTSNCCNRTAQRCVTRKKNNAKDNASYCNGNQPSNLIHNDDHCLENKARLRGGGCEDFNRRRDLESMPGMPIGDAYRSVKLEMSEDYCATKLDKWNSNFEARKTCKAEPKEFCEKNPCVGVNCLIRAFKKTQEFVDSLGKVPGLAGLGLTSPSDRLCASKEKLEEAIEAVPSDIAKHKKITSKPQRQNIENDIMIKTKPFMLPSAGRRDVLYGPVAQPDSFPIGSINSKELLLEDGTGPCGQSCCRSRRRKRDVALSSHDVFKSSKNKRHSKRNSRGTRNVKKKQRSRSDYDKRRHRKIRWIYLAGKTYPAVTYGHKNCNDPRRRIPGNMGWLWTAYGSLGRVKPRTGWRPGALSRTMKEIFKETRAGMLEDSRSRSRGIRSIKSRSQTSIKRTASKKLEEEEETEPPPTLHVLRKAGTYYLTMYPIKQESMDIPKLEIPMKPLQFKIVKDKDNCSETSSSTASDIELEFSPPAAVNRYRKKPDVIHVDTQVKEQEISEAFKPPAEKKKEKKAKKSKK